jgi:hypothetical protein
MTSEVRKGQLSERVQKAEWRWATSGVVACCALALALRFTSLKWGLPFLYHPDEPTNFTVFQRMLKDHDPNPHFFDYPSLFFYANAIVQAGHYAVCRLLGTVSSLSALPDLDVITMGTGFTALPSAFLAGRAFASACGVATVWAAYAMGRALSSRARVGLMAALLVAISPSILKDSRWIAPDGLVTLGVTLTLLACLNVLRHGRPRDYLWASALAGLTASMKYNGGLVGLSVVIAGLLRDGKRAVRNPWLYAPPFVAFASFALTSPYALLDFPHFWHDFMRQRLHYARGHTGAEGNTLAFYCQYLWAEEGIGPPLAIAATLLALVRRETRVILLSSFCLAYFCFINSFVVRFGRILVPIVPTLLVLAAWFWSECVARVARSNLPRGAGLTLAAASVLLISFRSFEGSLKIAQAASWQDNREPARLWIAAHIPARSRIAIEPYACYINRHRYVVSASEFLFKRDLAWLRRHEDYVVFASSTFERYVSDDAHYPREAAGYRKLFRGLQLLQTFDDPHGGGALRIYRTLPAH